ncbi:hypothetical protein FRC09_012373 [Ceratobasidium sp. 395]|nr:hypothetical protein FRC09_012373 [Ceratobasidium sp. 395]
MNSSWWPRRASASDTANPPRNAIRTARSFDPSSSNQPPVRSRTASNAGPDGSRLTVIANALGLGGSSLSKSKSRERLRSAGTSSTPESSRPSPTTASPSLIQTATFFASGAGAAPIAAASAAPARRVPKSSVGSSSINSRIPRSSPNRQTVVSTESGSSWGATTSSAEPIDQVSVWEPTTPSSGSEAKQSFQSMSMVVGEDPFARAPVWVSKSGTGETEKPRKKERERKLAVSAGSGPGGGLGLEDGSGSVSPLSLSPMSAFPSPPESMTMGYLSSPVVLPRRSASAVAAGSSSSSSSGSGVPRPQPQRSNSAQPRPGTAPGLGLQPTSASRSPRALTPQLTPPTHALPLTPLQRTPPTQNLPLTPTSQPSSISGSPPLRQQRSPSLRVDSTFPISAQQMHMHASALQDSESIMGASVYRMGDELSASEGDESEVYRRDVVSVASTLSSVREGVLPSPIIRDTPSPSVRTREALIVRGGMSAGSAEMGMGNMTALASGIVAELGGEAGSRKNSAGQLSASGNSVGGASGNGRVPPKRPSRSELRERASTNSLRTSNTIVPPVRGSSLYPAPRRAATDGSNNTSTSGLNVSPSTSNGNSPAASSVTTPNASTTSTPNASSASVPHTASSSSRPRTRDTTPTTSPSPSKQGARVPIPRTTSPPPRVSEEASQEFDHYVFAPQITDTDNASVEELTDEQGQVVEDVAQWLAWPTEDGQLLGVGSTPQNAKFGRRPPPSPTSFPWLAGSVRRPTRRDVVYPSGVHVIPTAVLGELARMGLEEEEAMDAVVARTVVEEEAERTVEFASPPHNHPPLSSIEERFPTPPASAPPSSPSPLTRLSSMSTSSLTSSCSSLVPEVVPGTISSRVEFSRHVRSGSYSDSELDFDEKRPRASGKAKSKLNGSGSGSLLPRTEKTTSTSTSIAWRCGSGNAQKCCGTRSLAEGPNTGGWKCCAERAPSGKHARCCASFVGRPCERARVSSTSSASVHEAAKALKRQRSFHLSSLPGIGAASGLPGMGSGPASGSGSSAAVSASASGNSGSAAGATGTPTHGKRNRFFHRPHTSHGKSTSYTLAEDDTRSVLSLKAGRMSKEDPGPSSSSTAVGTDDVFYPRAALAAVASPPMSPLARHEFKSKYILSPAKLNDHLKEALVPAPAPAPSVPTEPGLRSPRLEPTRQRSNTTTTTTTDTSGSHRSMLSIHSTDSIPMRSLLPPRRVHNTSLPVLSSSRAVEQPRRFVQSISTVTQPSAPGPPPPPRSPAVPAPGNGLPPPPRGRVGMQPIVSFISTQSAPTPRGSETPRMVGGVGLKHRSSRESCESQSTVRRERVIPMSFLEIEVEEESGEEDEDEAGADEGGEVVWERPGMQHTQSFLDLSSRQSGDAMRENEAMFT